jgi:Tol biopolymer transport system component
MFSFPRHLFGSLPLVTVAAALACGGESLVIPPDTGTLQVTTSTSGAEPDADGYIVTVDGTDHGAIPATGTVSVETLSAGDHVVGLSGVAGNCQAQGENPRTVAVTAGATASVTFAVTCTAPPANPGSIRITTVTPGPNPDADGYAFAIDGGTGQPIGANVSTTVGNIAAGDHTVGLSGVAANCTVGDANPRPVTVAAGATADVSFAITCSASTGSILVTTATTGSNPDNGYSVSVDGGTAQNIGANAPLTLNGITAGTHSVQLSGVAANCTVGGDNPITVTVTTGQPATAAFSITCTATAQARITFVRHDGTVGDVFTVNPDGSGRTKLTDGRTGFADTPQWSPDRSKIVFEGGPTRGDIWVINADGTGLRNLTNTPNTPTSIGPGHEDEAGPKWSPDGSRILFTRTTLQPPDGDVTVIDLYTMSANGGVPVQLTTTGTELTNGGYDWSPDGSRIAFESVRGGSQGIYVVSANGGAATRLSVAGDFGAPNWSPDGSRIVFLSEPAAPEPRQVWTMNADGSAQAPRTSQSGDNKESPSWSPDGSRIVYMNSTSAGSSDIWTVNANGTGAFNVTHSGGDNTSPVWSPDGRQIAFVVGFGISFGAARVHVVNADGTGQTDVSILSGFRPDW